MSELTEILRARAARSSRAPHGDGASVALVVEGGAMRGVVSAGMVGALEELGLTDAFDAVYGSSAGAFNAAYFLAGQARLGTTIYHEDINARAFINLARPLRGRPIVDLGFFVNDVASERKPLDVARVIAASSPLTVLATDVETAAPTGLTAFRSGRELLNAMRAGATMPIIAGAPWMHEGRRYFDASLSEPIPVPTAERGRHTHLLVLLTRPEEHSHGLSWFDRWYVLPRLQRESAALATAYRERFGPYSALVARLAKGIATGSGPDGRAMVICCRPQGPAIRKLERDAQVLKAGAEQGRKAVFQALGFGH